MSERVTQILHTPGGQRQESSPADREPQDGEFGARQNGLDMAFKIRGLYVREQENKGPEFSMIIIDSAHRLDWEVMRHAQPKIEVPGLNAPPKGS